MARGPLLLFCSRLVESFKAIVLLICSVSMSLRHDQRIHSHLLRMHLICCNLAEVNISIAVFSTLWSTGEQASAHVIMMMLASQPIGLPLQKQWPNWAETSCKWLASVCVCCPL